MNQLKILFMLTIASCVFALSSAKAEYVDGMSMYRGYFVPGAVDPSGRNCPFKECCCAESLAKNVKRRIEPLLVDREQVGIYWGHDVEVVSTLSRSYSIDGGKCRFEWWEIPNGGFGRDYKALGAVDGEWFGAHEAIEKGVTESDWPEYYSGDLTFEVDELQISQYDTPQVPFNSSRRLKVAVALYSAKDCPCEKEKVTLEFTQKLTGKGVFFGGAMHPLTPDEVDVDNWADWEIVDGIEEGEPDVGPPPYANY